MDQPASGRSETDPVELIEQSLAALRRGRSHRGPHEHDPHDHGGHEHEHGGHGHRGHPRGAGPWGGSMGGPPWQGGAPGEAGAPPWSRRGPRGAWEFRVGPVARFRLLSTLEAADHPLSVTELAAAIGVDQPRASRLVQAAAEEGLVVREADPDDARRTRIRLTEDGRAAVRSATSTRRQAIEAALDGFTDEERSQFAALLARFASGLQGRRP
ncbi:MAG TPA: MarR family winged helix-turn-helix transcriptional regulator [Agromyces sp.]|nr:MarR family winged helix-turn-helix transcriptional regulator [Agromyces sp.]